MILASRPDVTGKITYVIQCKCYESRVGNKAIQEAYFAGTRYGRMIAVVLTNNYFTRQAVEDARQTGVRLWDRDVLDQLIFNAYPPEQYEQWQDEVISKDISQSGHPAPLQAVEDARQTGVRLWDREVLKQLTCNAYPSELYERQQQDELHFCIVKEGG